MLILCEGETEYNYFEDIRKSKRLASASVVISGGEGDPGKLLTTAKEKKAAAEQERAAYDSIWIVFDRDEHKHYPNVIEESPGAGVHAAYSNPCFELWYILHSKDHSGPIERHAAEREVKRLHPGWAKPQSLYHEVQKREAKARTRAAQLRERQARVGNREHDNPSTRVDELVAEMNRL